MKSKQHNIYNYGMIYTISLTSKLMSSSFLKMKSDFNYILDVWFCFVLVHTDGMCPSWCNRGQSKSFKNAFTFSS